MIPTEHITEVILACWDGTFKRDPGQHTLPQPEPEIVQAKAIKKFNAIQDKYENGG